jgi:hypothetical protein
VLVDQVPGAMPISYRLKNRQGYLHIRKKDKIFDVKEKISAKESVDINSFRLTFGQNRPLDNNATVAESGITVNGTIDCASPVQIHRTAGLY